MSGDARGTRRALCGVWQALGGGKGCNVSRNGDLPLAGRRALVTGASKGIGEATAKRLAGDGAAVVVNYAGSAEAAERVVEEIGKDGDKAVALRADVACEGEVRELFARARREVGPLDVLVNNAGVEKACPLQDMSLHDWQRVIDVNLTGPFLCCREFVRGLLAERVPGVIVNVSSVHEVIPWRNFSHYCASKAGLKLFGQSIAHELAGHGIRVVGVAPGAIATPINEETLADHDERRKIESEIPWGRIGSAEEVASAIAWLVGTEADYVVGSTLFLDGGMLLYPHFV
jgi:glucose 1-dehydrogenase